MTGSFSMRCSLIALALILAPGVAVAQGPTFNLGGTPTEEELQPQTRQSGRTAQDSRRGKAPRRRAR